MDQVSVGRPLASPPGPVPLTNKIIPPVCMPPPPIAIIPEGHCEVVAVFIAVPPLPGKETVASVLTILLPWMFSVQTAQVDTVAVPPPGEEGYHDVDQVSVGKPLAVPLGPVPLTNSSIPPVWMPPPPMAIMPEGHCEVVAVFTAVPPAPGKESVASVLTIL